MRHFKYPRRYDRLLGNARKISMKSAIASAVGTGIPFFLILTVTAITIYLAGVMVDRNEIAAGFILQVTNFYYFSLHEIAAGCIYQVSIFQYFSLQY